MEFFRRFSFYGALEPDLRALFDGSVRARRFARGEEVYRGECAGLIFVQRGRLCAYTLSDAGREITLYRLPAGEVCLLSASCALAGADFDVFVRAEEDTQAWLLPSEPFRRLAERSLAFSAFVNERMARRLSDVMWLLDGVLNKKFDARLAALLLEERGYAGGDRLGITHERLAAHLGTAREAVSRMLKYFEGEGLVRLHRGGVELLDVAGLERLASEKK